MIEKLNSLLSHKYVKKVLYMRLKARLLVTLILFVMFLFIFYMMFVSPVITEGEKADLETGALKARIVSLIRKEKDLKELEKEVKILEEHNEKERITIPEKLSVPEFLSILSDNIKKSGVNITELSPIGVEKDKELDLYALNFRATVIGTFDNMIKLFVALLDMDQIVVITNMTIAKGNGNVLTMNFDLRTYSRTGV
ncbi:type IV pilus inner membrane component PilO [Francisella frigiditurris]|uniref:Pilus assembly, PilO family protein n=1 Tax=Francisella frigiditurris TaxID=1542390 RepID=A0A1J0KVK4_9GAMM|nr:type 4a pilus biogenesis protein PilO [Francisella frigiditurris]APC97785.1 pilus assembly, PilO family protein [Francisella frigiditurris]